MGKRTLPPTPEGVREVSDGRENVNKKISKLHPERACRNASLGRLVTLDTRRIEGGWHIAGDAQLEMILRTETAEP